MLIWRETRQRVLMVIPLASNDMHTRGYGKVQVDVNAPVKCDPDRHDACSHRETGRERERDRGPTERS